MTSGMVRTWLRTLLIQASWNYDRMIGIGMGYASEPMMRTLPGGVGGERYRAAMARACAYFNAHPYLAGLAVGAAARAEHDGASGEQIQRLRQALTGPLGSIGDQLVWAALLPFSSAVGLALTAWTSPLVGVIAFLVVYNTVHLLLRIWALSAGWRGGLQVASQLKTPLLQLGMRVGRPVAAFAVGVAIPAVVAWRLQDFDAVEVPRILLGAALVTLTGLIVLRRIWPSLGSLRFGVAVLVLAFLAGWL